MKEMKTKATMKFYLTWARTVKINKIADKNSGDQVGEGNAHSLLVRLQTGSATIEIIMKKKSQKSKNISTI